MQVAAATGLAQQIDEWSKNTPVYAASPVSHLRKSSRAATPKARCEHAAWGATEATEVDSTRFRSGRMLPVADVLPGVIVFLD
jgi:hypothetical protein